MKPALHPPKRMRQRLPPDLRAAALHAAEMAKRLEHVGLHRIAKGFWETATLAELTRQSIQTQTNIRRNVTAATILLCLMSEAVHCAETQLVLMKHPTRAEIVHLVNKSPAATCVEVAKILGKTKALIEHHLVVLERAGLVRRHRWRHVLANFPNHVVDSRQGIIQILLRNESARQVLDAVLKRPGTGLLQLPLRVKVQHGSVKEWLEHLQSAGLVHMEPGLRRVWPTSEAIPP